MSGKTKSISIRLPMGLYERLQKLATKNQLNLHAYCVKRLWKDSGWKYDIPNKEEGSRNQS